MRFQRSVFKPVLVLLIGAGLGWSLWQFSEALTGKDEPWDSHGFYYFGGLFVCGILATLISPRSFFWAPAGLFLGQVAYLTAMLGPAPLYILGILFLALYSVIGLAGSALCFGLSEAIRRRKDLTAVD